MDVLAVLNLSDIAVYFSKLTMFPLFDLAYYIVSILYLKYEPGLCISVSAVLGQGAVVIFEGRGQSSFVLALFPAQETGRISRICCVSSCSAMDRACILL